jgi:hypothetical protein
VSRHTGRAIGGRRGIGQEYRVILGFPVVSGSGWVEGGRFCIGMALSF